MPEEDFSWVTTEMFSAKLTEICENEDLLAIPGVYEIVSEHYNNEVLEALESERPEEEEEGDCENCGVGYRSRVAVIEDGEHVGDRLECEEGCDND